MRRSGGNGGLGCKQQWAREMGKEASKEWRVDGRRRGGEATRQEVTNRRKGGRKERRKEARKRRRKEAKKEGRKQRRKGERKDRMKEGRHD